MMKKIALSALLITSSALGGCYATRIDASDAEYPISMSAKPAGAYMRSFKTEVTAHHFIFGLTQLMGDPAVKAAINTEVKRAGGRAVNNLRLTTVHTFLNVLISSLTQGLYAQTTVVIEGDVIK